MPNYRCVYILSLSHSPLCGGHSNSYPQESRIIFCMCCVCKNLLFLLHFHLSELTVAYLRITPNILCYPTQILQHLTDLTLLCDLIVRGIYNLYEQSQPLQSVPGLLIMFLFLNLTGYSSFRSVSFLHVGRFSLLFHKNIILFFPCHQPSKLPKASQS